LQKPLHGRERCVVGLALGQRPLDLLKEGKARDIIVEFRRLQAGEPA